MQIFEVKAEEISIKTFFSTLRSCDSSDYSKSGEVKWSDWINIMNSSEMKIKTE